MRTLILLLTALALTLTACATDTTEGLDADEAAIEEALDDVTTACQDQDRDRLQDRLAEGVHEQLRDRDRTRLFGADDGATIELLSRTIEIDGDTATVTVVHEVTLDGDTTEVERTWLFERTDDGDWVLAEVPDCPFRE